MRFLSIYKGAESGPPSEKHMADMMQLIEEETTSGVLVLTEGCLPTALGARVRLDNTKVTVTDGPFTEAKEVVGGFAILEVASKAEAIEAAKRFLKVVGGGECEVRQIYEQGSTDFDPCLSGNEQAEANQRG